MKKILVVDNDRFILEFMADLLSKKGHDIVTAEGGLAALDILRTYTPDIIFIDLVMPNIDGRKLCALIRRMERLKDAFLIIISGVAAEEGIRFQELGADGCIAKGSFDEMGKNVLAVIDKAGPTSPRPMWKEVMGIEKVVPRNAVRELLFVKSRFEALLEKMSEGIVEVTSDGRIIYANRSALALIDIPEEKLLGASFVDLFEKADHKRIEGFLTTTGEQVKSVTYESPVRMNEYRVALDILPIPGDGSTTVVILADVTVVKKAEEVLREAHNRLEERVEKRTQELREKETKYRTIFEGSKDVIFITTVDGKIVDINQAAIDSVGYEKEEILETNACDFYVSADARTEFQRKIEENGFVWDYEVKFKGRRGKEKDCLMTASTWKGNDGSILGYHGIIRDVTSRKRAEEKVRHQKEFLENVLESLTHPFYVIDASDYKVKMANSAARKGGIAGEAKCYELMHRKSDPCSARGHPCPLEVVRETKRPVVVEQVRYDEEGNPRNVEVHGYPIFTNEGDLIQIIEYGVDATERKRLESVAEAANLMENIGYIFSGIRHEIGNPINSLKTTLMVLERKFETFKEDTTREFINDALNETARVEYLLRALKNFSLFEKPNAESIQMNDFMESLNSLVAEDFTKKGVELEILPSPEPIWAKVDPRALHQVVLNLLTNAVDALDEIDEPRIVISMEKVPGLVRIRVADNGYGMTEEQQRNLFRPFFTTKPQGTGLGLVIVKKMLTRMNSTIRILSQRNKGTIVILQIPEGESESSKPEKKARDH